MEAGTPTAVGPAVERHGSDLRLIGHTYTRGVRRTRIRSAFVVAVALIASACSSADDGATGAASTTTVPSTTVATDVPTPASTVPDTVASTTTPGTTPATSPVTEPVTVATDAPTTTVQRPVLSDAPCQFTSFGDGPAAITFTTGGRVYELSPDWTTGTCLSDVAGSGVNSLRWSPSGEAVLLDSSRVLDAKGVRDTGYRVDNAGVSWSFPTGKALIAPAVADGALLWRTAGQPDTRRDISFLTRTDVAAYHVAGKNVFAAGVDPDGVAGIFVASNRGENRRTVATLDDPTTRITELAADVSGSQLYVIHDHGSFWEMHQISFPGLALGTLLDTPEPISHLTVDYAGGNVAVQVGDCAATTRTIAPTWGPNPVGFGTDLADLSTTPIGWLDPDHLVVAARAGGCTGPTDVWVVERTGATHWVLSAIDTVSVRTKVATFGELPDDINAQAPG